MVLIGIEEILNLLIMTIAVGYIFSGYVKKPRTEFETPYGKIGFDWGEFKTALYVAAPAVVLHELAHKFVAIAFGLSAVFKSFWQGLVLGIFLKAINSPLIILAPGYVEITGDVSPLLSAVTAAAGPLTNLLLFGISHWVLETRKLSRNQAVLFYLSKQINLWLFIFNMIPIPPLDGSKVLFGLINTIF